MIKAVIFDVDGVVLTTQDADGRYFWSRTAKEDLGLSKAHFQKIFGPAWLQLTRGKGDTISYLETVFSDPLFRELPITPTIFIDYWLSRDGYVNERMREFVSRMRLPCYLGTNQEAYRTAHIQKLVGRFFSGCFASYALKSIKPEAQFFIRIEEALKLRPEEILLIDDTAANCDGARARGWDSFHFAGDFDELAQFLLKRNALPSRDA